MTVVIDASVALKWVMEEEGSLDARALLKSEILAAPELMLVECANVLAMRVRRGLLTPEHAAVRLDALLGCPVREVPSRGHLARAQALAGELGQTVYDSLYLAVALAEGATFITADARFFQAAAVGYAPFLRLL